ncbi:MAG: phosphatidate cytidylyltransferase [Phycisphaerae bacterium]|nr:phosphatidate cytidylyltransferase [Phycisphaerae bacterium]
MKKTMITRITFGGSMIALLVGIFLLDWFLEGKHCGEMSLRGLPLVIVFFPIMILGFIEFARMVKTTGVRVLWVSGIVGIVLLVVGSWITGLERHGELGGFPRWLQEILFLFGTRSGILLVLGLAFLEQMIVARLKDALRSVACTFLGIAYIGACAGCILEIRMFYGLEVLILFLAAVKCTDIGAYFTGSFFGKHKLIPWLSPGKTWEGLAGGLAAAAIVGLLGWWLLKWTAAPVLGSSVAILFAVIVGVFGQFGDLCESLMKRSAGVKDSGAVVPEFGGVLDILDSPLLAAPIAFAFLVMLAAH